MLKKFLQLAVLLSFPFFSDGKLPDITPQQTDAKIKEIMHSHASYKEMSPLLIKRILINYIEEIDPTKSYFIESDIKQWIDPTDGNVEKVLREFNNHNYQTFDDIHAAMVRAIKRRQALEKNIDLKNLPKNVKAEEFKDLKWTTSQAELQTRLERLKALQLEAAEKLSEPVREKSLQRIAKKQTIFEEEMQEKDPEQHQKRLLTNILKATAAALDSHTAYFTPDEAAQFMINVQQRLVGIGAQLRDDINGFTIVKILEGGPAERSKELKAKDRIIAVNGEPVVGMDIIDAVGLIRGPENSTVLLTIVRENPETKKEETLDVTILRNEIVLKETRYESLLEPYGDGAIGYLKLFSFYQDADSSSSKDLAAAIKRMKEETKLKAIVLDLRFNSGGMLSQAVEVAGLFLTKGIVVSIKDEHGEVQHLRNLEEEKKWAGPLIVLINRASASASEIVAGTLQDYGRAIIVGDDHSYGKGSFQTFTLNASKSEDVNPEGEYKVTRGRYYTVSGRTPQLTGVYSDIVVPGPLSQTDIGEKLAKYPLENDSIKENFDDDLSDVPASQREKIRKLYKFNLQPKLAMYEPYLLPLAQNSALRILNNKIYQEFIKELKESDKDKEKEKEEEEAAEETTFSKADLQLTEAYNIVKDLLFFMLKEKITQHSQPPL